MLIFFDFNYNSCICTISLMPVSYFSLLLISKSLPLRPWQTRTHCCRHKCFPVCPRAQHLFLVLLRNILCPQQMFPSLRSPRNIIANNVSVTMCPRLPEPLPVQTSVLFSKLVHENIYIYMFKN